MSHYFIDKHDPRVADLFRRLEKAGKALDKLESSGGRTLKGGAVRHRRGIVPAAENQQAYIAGIPHGADHSLFDSGQGTIHGIRDTEIPGRFPEEMYRGTGMGKEERPTFWPFFLFQFNIVFMPGSCQTTAVVVALRTSHRRKASAFPDFKRKASAAIISSEYSSTIPPSRLRSRR